MSKLKLAKGKEIPSIFPEKMCRASLKRKPNLLHAKGHDSDQLDRKIIEIPKPFTRLRACKIQEREVVISRVKRKIQTQSCSTKDNEKNDGFEGVLPKQSVIPMDSVFKISDSCKDTLKRILLTAVQFQRHSHRHKLSLSDFNKALTVYDLEIESENIDGVRDVIHSKAMSENCNRSEPRISCPSK